MRVLPILILAIAGAAMAVVAEAQTRGGAKAPPPQQAQPMPPQQAEPTTNGQGPTRPIPEAPIGHRQPRASDVPNSIGVSPLDRQLDQDLQICRKC
jgi:hypothetical protein